MKDNFERNLLRRLVGVRLDPDTFDPDESFYQSTGISKEKFKEMWEGTSPISGKDYVKVARTLGISKEMAMDSRQLLLFREGREE